MDGDGAGGAKGSGPRTAYAAAGVDVAAGDRAVELLRGHVSSTARAEVVGAFGGFGGAVAMPAGYHEPLLISSTDGVGTKTAIATAVGRFDTIGRDLVAMCADDVVCSGAEPLFFLDYVAVGRLDPANISELVGGVAAGCQDAGCALVGGETAEHPGLMQPGEFDLAGFCVGVVEKSRRVDGSAIRPGDRLLGLASSGFHSNGYSLVRRVLLERMALPLGEAPPGLDAPLGDLLLRPTRIYVRALRALHAADLLRGAAHITGGGLVENPQRMLPPDARLQIQIELGTWDVPPVFDLVARGGGVAEPEMLRTFNMGLGMVVCVPDARAPEARRLLEAHGERVFDIGQIVESATPDAPVELLPRRAGRR
jgi:phosphoribosylformylglycinamidine cyclo-ligase